MLKIPGQAVFCRIETRIKAGEEVSRGGGGGGVVEEGGGGGDIVSTRTAFKPSHKIFESTIFSRGKKKKCKNKKKKKKKKRTRNC